MTAATEALRLPAAEAAASRAATAFRLRAVRRLSVAIVAAASVEFVIATIGVQIGRLPPATDFASYYFAGAQARDGLSPYDRAAIAARGHALGFVHEQFPFLYPPPFALAVQPLARLSYARARQVWMLAATLALFAALGITALLMRRQAAVLDISDPRFYWTLLAALVPAALNSTSVHADIRAGSVGAFLLLALCIFAWGMLQRGRAAAAGMPVPPALDALLAAALATATLVKLTPVLLLPYAWWRGARRAAVLALLFLGLAMLPALAHWGPGIAWEYLQGAILPSLRAENGWAHNQSLDGFLCRLFVPGALQAVPPGAPWLKHALSTVLGLAVAVGTLRVLARRRRAPGLVPVEIGLVVLAILVLMKITWVHTLAAMLFVWPALMLAIWRAAERGAPWARRTGSVACVGFFLAAAHLPILWGAHWRGPWIVVTGAHLYGLLILWGTACFILRREAEILDAGELE